MNLRQKRKEIIKAKVKDNIDNIIYEVFSDKQDTNSIEGVLRYLEHSKELIYRTIFDVLMEKYEVTSQWYYEELANKISMDLWSKNLPILNKNDK